MARLQFLCVIVAVALGVQFSLCHPADPDNQLPIPSLIKEEEENSRYKTLEANATLLKLLGNNKDGVSGSEIFDMLNSRDDNPQHMDLPSFPEDLEDAKAEVPLDVAPSELDSQTEFIQAPGKMIRKDTQRIVYAGSRGEPVGTAAGIMVLVTCSIVCLAYTVLIVWRRIFLKRNGLKHELLRNEENVAETRIEM